MDVSPLRAAYHAFFEAAEALRMRERVAEVWTAEEVVAHVAANDALIANVLRAVRAGKPQPYDNASVVDDARVAAVARALGDLDGILALARGNASVVLDLAARLSDAEAAVTIPHVRIRDGKTLQVDGPLEVARFLAAHSRVHLPAHTRQLAAFTAVGAVP